MSCRPTRHQLCARPDGNYRESGAGKSILLGALGLLMGHRAKAEVFDGTEADVRFAATRVLHCINSFAQTISSRPLTTTA